jgi:hypothetical protein
MPKRKTSDEIKTNKASAKEDTESNSYRNRLFRVFGDSIRLKSGGLPSPIKGLVELTLRTWTKLRYGKNVSEDIRDRTVTVGIQKVLRTICYVPGTQELTAESIQSKFIELSDYVSRVRVLASLLANFICLEKLDNGLDLPETDAKFFSACLCVSRSSKGGSVSIHEAFQRFCTATGNIPLSKKIGVSTLFERQVCFFSSNPNLPKIKK